MKNTSSTKPSVFKIPKHLRYTSKFLSTASPKIATKIALKLFTTPIKHPVPKREQVFLEQSFSSILYVDSIQKKIRTYQYGNGPKKILLCHGWSGRASQLVTMATYFKEKEYTIISFDAPAHGKSKGKTSNMLEFIACIEAIAKEYKALDAAIGHSLGGVALLNAVALQKINTKKLVTIGAADSITDVIQDFCKKLHFSAKVAKKLKKSIDKKTGISIETHSSGVVAKKVFIPTLVIHDKKDKDVSVSCARAIRQQLKIAELYISDGLGHRKILADSIILKKIHDFIDEKKQPPTPDTNNRIPCTAEL